MSTVLSTAKLTVELSGGAQPSPRLRRASLLCVQPNERNYLLSLSAVGGSDCSERLRLDPLLVMGPHSNNLDHLLFIKNLVHQSV